MRAALATFKRASARSVPGPTFPRGCSAPLALAWCWGFRTGPSVV